MLALVFASVSSSIFVSLCRDDVSSPLSSGHTAGWMSCAQWASTPPTSPMSNNVWRRAERLDWFNLWPHFRKFTKFQENWWCKETLNLLSSDWIFLEGKETMRRELENWYGTKKSWIKWCHFNVRLPCDCKKLFVNYPATDNRISSSSQLYMTTWRLPDPDLTFFILKRSWNFK